MAKKQTAQLARMEPTVLVVSKDHFSETLSDRILKGEAILQSANNFQTLGAAQVNYRSWHDFNLELLKQSFNNEVNEYWKDYKGEGEYTVRFVSMGGRSQEQILGEFNSVLIKKIDNLKRLQSKLPLLKSNTSARDKISVATELDKSQVFIVHGHDEAAKHEVARFIDRLGLHPIILHEQASSGKTIIEKIEEYTSVGFGIVLYTECDLGAKKGEEHKLSFRARQNVVFEHGFLIGKIGRKNVCALVKGNVETPGDITGVVYVSMQSDWKFALAKELRNSGYEVDMNKVV